MVAIHTLQRIVEKRSPERSVLKAGCIAFQCSL